MATLCPIILTSYFSSAVHRKIVSLRDWEFPSAEFIHSPIDVYWKRTLIFMIWHLYRQQKWTCLKMEIWNKLWSCSRGMLLRGSNRDSWPDSEGEAKDKFYQLNFFKLRWLWINFNNNFIVTSDFSWGVVA